MVICGLCQCRNLARIVPPICNGSDCLLVNFPLVCASKHGIVYEATGHLDPGVKRLAPIRGEAFSVDKDETGVRSRMQDDSLSVLEALAWPPITAREEAL